MTPQADSHLTIALTEGWTVASAAAGTIATPAALTDALHWLPTQVPGTAAGALLTASVLPRAALHTRNYDSDDWWFRTRFSKPATPCARIRLQFDGLATIAEVWLNDVRIFDSSNMFVGHSVDVTDNLHQDDLQQDNELVICFRALTSLLAERKPRPRWKTRLIAQQNLRWIRTALLGRITSWHPLIAAVGPWRDIYLQGINDIDIEHIDLQPGASDGHAWLAIDARIALLNAASLQQATLVITSPDGRTHRHPLPAIQKDRSVLLQARVELPDLALWWPHTHGEPTLHDCHIEFVTTDNAINVNGGRLGFRELTLQQDDGRVQFVINGVDVFCRGACWTTQDIVTRNGSREDLRQTLQLVRDANLNMVRIGGTMQYEHADFHELCDELGILVWQEFMFANMDYPVGDATFQQAIETEARYQLRRLQRYASIAMYCGGSEVEQQAAMLGLPPEQWSNSFFAQTLPDLCKQLHAGVPYVPSSPSGGALPIHVDTGIAHYYGVGAYKRPLSDVRRSQVKFAAESLGFSNVPEAATMELLIEGSLPVPHHPAWKTGVPRDNGAGWDFEDTRDFYLQQLFNVDAVHLRSHDPERYFALSRVASGEIMKNVIAEWRRPNSGCGGGLVWFLKDLTPGAGWGIIDSEGRTKAAYHALQRICSPRAVLMTDEGLNGLALHVVNDTNEPLNARLELEILQFGHVRTAFAQQAIEVNAHAAQSFNSDALLAGFTDITYAYRFGPARHDVVVARLVAAEDTIISEDYFFPQGHALPWQHAAQIDVGTTKNSAGELCVTISSSVFLQHVLLEIKDFRVHENYFHIAPGRQKIVRITSTLEGNNAVKNIRGYLSALNLHDSITLRLESP